MKYTLVLCTAALLAGCETTGQPIVAAPVELQPDLVITDARKQECQPVEITLGADKLQLILAANVEIEDCEAKRLALQQTIDEENARRAKARAAELKRIQPKR